MPNPNDPYRPDLPYRCPDCVTTGEPVCGHPRPTIAQGAACGVAAERARGDKLRDAVAAFLRGDHEGDGQYARLTEALGDYEFAALSPEHPTTTEDE